MSIQIIFKYLPIFLFCSLILINAFNKLFSEALPCNGYVYMKDDQNCSWFYRCDITGRSQHLECYPGLFFNEFINDCDLPYNVPECAEYPFFCQFLSLCWPPVIEKPINNSSLHQNNTEIE